MRLIAIVILLSLNMGCKSHKSYIENDYLAFKKISNFENCLIHQDLTLNRIVARSLIKQCDNFTSTFPKSIYLEETLVIAAKSSDGLNFNKKNINYINQLLEHFPESENAPIYLYNKGKILEEKLNDTLKAFNIYQTIINKYPNSEIGKSLPYYLDFIRNKKTN